jgi:hypothetical protein
VGRRGGCKEKEKWWREQGKDICLNRPSLSVSGYVHVQRIKSVGGGGGMCSCLCDIGDRFSSSKEDLSYFSDRSIWRHIFVHD